MMRNLGPKVAYDRQYSDIELIRRFLRYLGPFRTMLFFIIIGIIASAVVTIFPPIMVQNAFDLLEAESPWLAVLPYAVGYVILSLFLWGLQVVLGILVTIVTQKVIKQIQIETYVSLQEQDLMFFDRQATGQIMSRVTNDSQELTDMLNVVTQFVSNLLILVTVLGWMFIVNWRLTLVTLIMAPFVFLVALTFRRITRRTTGDWRAAIGAVNASFQESVSGISIAKAFGREEKSKEEFEVINNDTFKYAKKRAFAVMGVWPLMDGISTIGVFGITLYGSSLIFSDLATASTILLFLLLLNRFLYPLVRVASQFSTIQSGFAAMERIFSIVDAEIEIKNPENPVIKKLKGHISFKKVHQYYEEGVPVLKDINLDIKPGESIAVVGHTGAGKTTIASLLMRFYDIQKGSI
ncbi:MAG: ABC transporter ATP-binding protein, partial [Candidatus Heimdallarchaeaceae archaeon]